MWVVSCFSGMSGKFCASVEARPSRSAREKETQVADTSVGSLRRCTSPTWLGRTAVAGVAAGAGDTSEAVELAVAVLAGAAAEVSTFELVAAVLSGDGFEGVAVAGSIIPRTEGSTSFVMVNV